MIGSQRPQCHEKENPGAVDSIKGVERKEQMSFTTDRYPAEIFGGLRDWQTRDVTAIEALSQRLADLTKKGGK